MRKVLKKETFSKQIKIAILLISLGILFPNSYFQKEMNSAQVTLYKSSIAKVFKKDLLEIVDYHAFIPGLNEALKIKKNLLDFPGYMDNLLRTEGIPDLDQVKTKLDYTLKKYREFIVLRRTLVELYESNLISLFPGEAFTLTFRSYCLDSKKKSPSKKEFYYIDAIPETQSKWLVPVLEYSAKSKDQKLPTQALIWNMVRKVPYQDLPSNQQRLLTSAIPDAEKLYSKNKVANKIKKGLLGQIKRKARVAAPPLFDVIDDVNDVSRRIEESKSTLKLVWPKWSVYRLENGLLVSAKSTGSFKKITLTVANPKSNNKIISFKRSSSSGLLFAMSSPVHRRSSLDFPGGDNFDEWKGRWDTASDYYGKAQEAGKALDAFEQGAEGVDNYVRGRGFDESMAVFDSINKGNSKFKEASDLFKGFNKQFFENDPKSPKKFNPGKYRFKPGRGDVQPLGLGN